MNIKCIMIRCILPIKNIEMINVLHTELNAIVIQHWPKAYTSIEHNTDYWKIQGNKDIAFGIVNSFPITVRNFIDCFPIKWNYTETMINTTIKKNYYESAIWSQLCAPQETFLLPIVEWVNVFTWIE